MKKVFGFKDINVLMDNIEEYINLIESGNDYMILNPPEKLKFH
jgi:hypothetical protein